MLFRTALNRQIKQLEQELADFERGRVRVTKRIDGHATWEDATHDMMLRTRARIDALQEMQSLLPNDL